MERGLEMGTGEVEVGGAPRFMLVEARERLAMHRPRLLAQAESDPADPDPHVLEISGPEGGN